MKPITIYDRSGIIVSVKGDFTRDELEILEQESNSTISCILKFRKFGGGLK